MSRMPLRFALPPPRVMAREGLTIGLTAGVLVWTELHEYMPEAHLDETQACLAILSGILFACIGPALWDDMRAAVKAAKSRHADHGPRTRGIRVDRRVRSVDVFENLLSFGNLEPILATTLEAAELRAGDCLIDVGCGSGRLAIRAASILGDGKALGIDATPGMIELARSGADTAGSKAEFRVGVGEDLPLPDGYADAVTSSYFLHHLPSDVKAQALREMWRVLAPGGRLVITDYARPRGLLGYVASFPMRFNVYEYVRGQLNGELERLIEAADIGEAEVCAVFVGYITVLRIRRPMSGEQRIEAKERLTPPAPSLSASGVPAA